MASVIRETDIIKVCLLILDEDRDLDKENLTHYLQLEVVWIVINLFFA